jgi:hypothetical protein
MHAPPAHATPGRHSVAHEPQNMGVERSASQPLAARPSQSAKPARHAIVHELEAHAPVALARAGHPTPHAPQLAGSRVVSAHRPPHMAVQGASGATSRGTSTAIAASREAS